MPRREKHEPRPRAAWPQFTTSLFDCVNTYILTISLEVHTDWTINSRSSPSVFQQVSKHGSSYYLDRYEISVCSDDAQPATSVDVVDLSLTVLPGSLDIRNGFGTPDTARQADWYVEIPSELS